MHCEGGPLSAAAAGIGQAVAMGRLDASNGGSKGAAIAAPLRSEYWGYTTTPTVHNGDLYHHRSSRSP